MKREGGRGKRRRERRGERGEGRGTVEIEIA